MSVHDDPLQVLVGALVESDHDTVWQVGIDLDSLSQGANELEARVVIPTPYPAAWVAAGLSEFDRSFRWSLRAAEKSTPVHVLQASGSRPAVVRRGLLLVEVEPGSFLGRLDLPSALDSVFKRKTWVIIGGWMSAVTLAGWTVSEVSQVFDHGGDEAPAIQTIYEGPVYNISGTVIIRSGNQTVIIKCSTGSESTQPPSGQAPHPTEPTGESGGLTTAIPARSEVRELVERLKAQRASRPKT